MLSDGSAERNDEIAVQTSDNKMTRSNLDRVNPRLRVASDRSTQPMPAIATPIALAATE
jgi:hypothetical protein